MNKCHGAIDVGLASSLPETLRAILSNHTFICCILRLLTTCQCPLKSEKLKTGVQNPKDICTYIYSQYHLRVAVDEYESLPVVICSLKQAVEMEMLVSISKNPILLSSLSITDYYRSI